MLGYRNLLTGRSHQRSSKYIYFSISIGSGTERNVSVRVALVVYWHRFSVPNPSYSSKTPLWISLWAPRLPSGSIFNTYTNPQATYSDPIAPLHSVDGRLQYINYATPAPDLLGHASSSVRELGSGTAVAEALMKMKCLSVGLLGFLIQTMYLPRDGYLHDIKTASNYTAGMHGLEGMMML